MRSRTANVLLLLVGLVLVVLGLDRGFDLVHEIWLARRSSVAIGVEGYALVFGCAYLLVGSWCVRGAIDNLRKSRDVRRSPVRRSERLVKWHLVALAIAIAGDVLAALAYWRFRILSLGGLKAMHWILVGLFALIPFTVTAAIILRRRER